MSTWTPAFLAISVTVVARYPRSTRSSRAAPKMRCLVSGSEPPKGLVVHLAVERPEGGLRYVDVWESEEDWNRFAEERLHPVVHPLLGSVFGAELPPEPERVPLPVIHVWKP